MNEMGPRRSCDASAVNLFHAAHRGLQSFQHLVAGFRQALQLVAGAHHGQTPGEVADAEKGMMDSKLDAYTKLLVYAGVGICGVEADQEST